jgi:hypothetical protein
MFAKAFEFSANGGAVAIEPPSDLGKAQLTHALVEDTDAFLFGKMRVGHRRLGLSMVVSW